MSVTPEQMTRVRVERHGNFDVEVAGAPGSTVYLFRLLSDDAVAWVQSSVETEDWQWLGGGLGVEHRFIEDLISGARASGLRVRRTR